MSSLYDLNQEYLAIMHLLEEGATTEEEVQMSLSQLQDDTETKLEAYGKIIRQFQADSEGYKVEIDRLQKKRQVAENAIERMKKAVYETLNLRGGDRKVKTPLFSFWVQKNPPSVMVQVDPEELPIDYQVHEIRADRQAIKEALKAGKSIHGCGLLQGESVRIK